MKKSLRETARALVLDTRASATVETLMLILVAVVVVGLVLVALKDKIPALLNSVFSKMESWMS